MLKSSFITQTKRGSNGLENWQRFRNNSTDHQLRRTRSFGDIPTSVGNAISREVTDHNDQFVYFLRDVWLSNQILEHFVWPDTEADLSQPSEVQPFWEERRLSFTAAHLQEITERRPPVNLRVGGRFDTIRWEIADAIYSIQRSIAFIWMLLRGIVYRY